MKKNVGGFDRIARLTVGPVLAVVGLAGLAGLVGLSLGPLPGLLVAAVALLVGAVFVVTGTTQQCPLNSALGLDTYGGDAPVEDPETESAPAR